MRNKERLLGVFISVPSPELVEICAFSGFDFVVLDLEHGAIDWASAGNMVRAAQVAGVPALVRPGRVEHDDISKALDAGAAGIVAPQINSAEQARALVAECRYPPAGKRGVAFYVRAHRFSREIDWRALERADRQTVVGVMIEASQGVERAADICAVDGVDFVLCGAQDLSVQLGEGPHNAAALAEAQARITAAARQAGIAQAVAAASGEAAQRQFEAGHAIVITGLLPLLSATAGRYVAAARAGRQ